VCIFVCEIIASMDDGFDVYDECMKYLNYTEVSLQVCLLDLIDCQGANGAHKGCLCSWEGIGFLGWVLIVSSSLFSIFMGLTAGWAIFFQWWEYYKKGRKAREWYTHAIFRRENEKAVRRGYEKAQIAEDWERYVKNQDPNKSFQFSAEETCKIIRELIPSSPEIKKKTYK